MAQNSKHIWLIVLAALAGLGAWAWQRSVERAIPTVRIHTLGRQDIRTGVITSGKAEPSVVRELRAEIAGMVSKVLVKVGDQVQAGTPLAELSIPALQAELAQAASQLATATEAKRFAEAGGTPAQLAELQAQVAQARRVRDQAAGTLKQSEALAEKGALALIELDQARRTLTQATDELARAEQRWVLRIDPHAVQQADNQIKAAQAALDLAEARQRMTTIRAPLAGVVYSLPVRVGDFADTNSVIARIGDLRHLTIRVFVDEPDLGRISLGQQVRLAWDGLPEKFWTGTVERKPVEVESRDDRTGGEVLASVDNASGDLLPNTNLAVEIITASRTGVLALPREALEAAGNSRSVFVVEGQRIARRDVELGLMNPTHVEIAKGLAEGDQVVVGSSQKLTEGQQIRLAAN